MKNAILIGAGVAGVAAVAYYLYTKKSAQALVAQSTQSPTQPSLPSTQSSYTAPTPTVKQTMWKDKDGNIFQLTSEYGKWGYVIKVNGSVQKSWNMMETMFLRSDGYVVGVDNNGSVFEYKNNGWHYVIKDNKTQADQYLKQHGQLPIFSLNGLGCYLMS